MTAQNKEVKEYTCDMCGVTYLRSRSDEECWKEYNEIMPEAEHDEISVVCDYCWQDFMEWFKTLSQEQKKKIRDDYIKATAN